MQAQSLPDAKYMVHVSFAKKQHWSSFFISLIVAIFYVINDV